MDNELYEKLLNSSFRFLSIRPRSRKELQDYLAKKTKSESLATIDKVIERLTQLGYVDDLKFSEWLVDQRQSHKPKGKRFIEHELQTKGIAKDIILLVTQPNAEKPQKDLALTAVSKKLHLWDKLTDMEKKQKIFAYLARQGFEMETIRTVIDEITQKSYNNFEE
jgi:regulatory protein